MNELLMFGPNGRRLLAEFEGEPRLKARLCEGGRWELSYGVTFHADETPIRENETCTIEGHWELFGHAIAQFEMAVQHAVTVDLNQSQYEALVALCYNIGPENFSTSTVLRMVNDRRWEDAAAAFGMWMKATSPSPTAGDLRATAYSAIIAHGRWIGPQGQPASYVRALRGLLRRHYSEACLFMGWDWTDAVREDEAVQHVALAVSRRDWNPTRARWEDVIGHFTPWSEIERIAQLHPLDSYSAPTAASPSVAEETPAVMQPQPLPGAPAPVPAVIAAGKPIHPDSRTHEEVGLDPNAPLKPMEASERFMGAVRLMIGAFIRAAGRNTAAAGSGVATVGAVLLELAQQPMAIPILAGGAMAGGGLLVWWVGHSIHVSGLKKKKLGEMNARQALF